MLKKKITETSNGKCCNGSVQDNWVMRCYGWSWWSWGEFSYECLTL